MLLFVTATRLCLKIMICSHLKKNIAWTKINWNKATTWRNKSQSLRNNFNFYSPHYPLVDERHHLRISTPLPSLQLTNYFTLIHCFFKMFTLNSDENNDSQGTPSTFLFSLYSHTHKPHNFLLRRRKKGRSPSKVSRYQGLNLKILEQGIPLMESFISSWTDK